MKSPYQKYLESLPICPDCNGSGQVGSSLDVLDNCPCPTCEGSGRIEEEN